MSKRAVELVSEAVNFAYKKIDKRENDSLWSGFFSGRLVELVLADVIELCEKHPDLNSKEIISKITEHFDLE